VRCAQSWTAVRERTRRFQSCVSLITPALWPDALPAVTGSRGTAPRLWLPTRSVAVPRQGGVSVVTTFRPLRAVPWVRHVLERVILHTHCVGRARRHTHAGRLLPDMSASTIAARRLGDRPQRGPSTRRILVTAPTDDPPPVCVVLGSHEANCSLWSRTVFNSASWRRPRSSGLVTLIARILRPLPRTPQPEACRGPGSCCGSRPLYNAAYTSGASAKRSRSAADGGA
jgi:hypothetical protein